MRCPFRFLLSVGCFALVAATVGRGADDRRAPTADEQTWLQDTVRRTVTELPRWAYTETRIMRDEKGRPKNQAVVRYDPSKPYEQQWTPLEVNGRPPTEKDFAKYRRRGEQARKREESPVPPRDDRPSLGELIELSYARVAEETPTHLVFEVPLRKQNNTRFPPEKFVVLARLDKVRKTLESVAVNLREPFRLKLVAKVKSGEGRMEFTTVDPKFAPTMTAIQGDASVSILFVSVGGELDLKRTDFKRVKPYGDKFEVQIGELKALDF